jgi:glycosyltransferase involved in cell wall biosynthesis
VRLLARENTVRVSIIITNYNYGDRLGAAIDSALAVSWPEKEIIVVDDGSTDHSVDIIRAYGDRIKALFKTNGGQNSAANTGFFESSGEVVFFLDSDDTLFSSVALRLVPLFTATTAKVQFPLLAMRPDGSTAALYPRFPKTYSPSDVATSVSTTGFYVSSPTTGNAWARWALDKAFPLPDRWTSDVAAKYFDGYLSTMASRLGEVVTVTDPLGTYYINPNNMWSKQFSPKLIAEACKEDLARSEYVNAKLRTLGLRPIDRWPFTDWMKRLVYRKYDPHARPLQGNWPMFLIGSIRSAAIDPGISIKSRILVISWMIAVVALPRRLALPLVKLRFVQGYRPRIVSWLLASRRHRATMSRSASA